MAVREVDLVYRYWVYARFRPYGVATITPGPTPISPMLHATVIGWRQRGRDAPTRAGAEMGAARASQLSGRFMSVVMGFCWRILPQHELNRLTLLKARTARRRRILANRANMVTPARSGLSYGDQRPHVRRHGMGTGSRHGGASTLVSAQHLGPPTESAMHEAPVVPSRCSGRMGHNEKNDYRSASAIRIFGTYSTYNLSARLPVGPSEVRGAIS